VAGLNIVVHTERDADDVRVDITCREVNSDIEKMIAALRMMDQQLTGKIGNQIFVISAKNVIYVEAVDRKCFLYTKDSYYETDFKLYQLEEQLGSSGFIRISKSVLINLKEVRSLKAEFNRRLLVTMCNGEQMIASRQYADRLKKVLGVK